MSVVTSLRLLPLGSEEGNSFDFVGYGEEPVESIHSTPLHCIPAMCQALFQTLETYQRGQSPNLQDEGTLLTVRNRLYPLPGAEKNYGNQQGRGLEGGGCLIINKTGWSGKASLRRR